MTKNELAMVLKILMSNYPNTKIKEPEVTLESWYSEFGEYPKELIEIAARFHMKSSTFFPSIAEIRKQIPRAELLRQFEETNKPKPVDPVKEAKINAELQTIIDDMIEREEEMYGDFLDFER